MKGDFPDPPWEEIDIVIVDEETIEKARCGLIGCEGCTDEAEIPFDALLDRVTGRDPRTTDYVLGRVINCMYCGGEINEKTLVTVRAL